MLPIAVIFLFGLLGILFISAVVYVISKLVFDNRTDKALSKRYSPVRVTSMVAGVMLAGLLIVCICFSLFSINIESGYEISEETVSNDIGI
ncbi:MAG: hypothetical protein J6W36_03985 [Clostridiales bacterium]|nr:hypothetical protein [Clostridiales bacterium]